MQTPLRLVVFAAAILTGALGLLGAFELAARVGALSLGLHAGLRAHDLVQLGRALEWRTLGHAALACGCLVVYQCF